MDLIKKEEKKISEGSCKNKLSKDLGDLEIKLSASSEINMMHN
jgi:hypothetical protein